MAVKNTIQNTVLLLFQKSKTMLKSMDSSVNTLLRIVAKFMCNTRKQSLENTLLCEKQNENQVFKNSEENTKKGTKNNVTICIILWTYSVSNVNNNSAIF